VIDRPRKERLGLRAKKSGQTKGSTVDAPGSKKRQAGIMKKIGGFIVTGLMAAMIGCSAVYDVNYYYDKSAVFPKLQTFNWQPSTTIDESTAVLIRKTVNAQLTAKGFRLTTDNPDFLIIAHITRQEKSRLEDWDYGYYNTPY
jgi:hypothetical protein